MSACAWCPCVRLTVSACRLLAFWCRPLVVFRRPDVGGRSGRFLAGEVVASVSFRRRSCRSSALFGLVAACVASCRVFLSLSVRCLARVKKSLVGLISGSFPSAVRVGVSL